MQYDSLKGSDNPIEKYPDRVPMMITISANSRLTFQDNSKIKKYLVSKSDHFYHLLLVIRNQISLRQSESLYLFINNVGMIKAESQVNEVYEKYKSEDHFLRVNVTEYATFGL